MIEKWGKAQIASAKDYNCKDKNAIRDLDDELASRMQQIQGQRKEYGDVWASAKSGEARTEILTKAKEIVKVLSPRTELIAEQKQFHEPAYWQRNQWLTRPFEPLTAAHTDWFPEQIATLKSHAKLLEALSILVENSTKSVTLADLQTCDAGMFQHYLNRAQSERNFALLGLCQAAVRSRQYFDKTEELAIKTSTISAARDIQPPEGEEELVQAIEEALQAATAVGSTYQKIAYDKMDVQRRMDPYRTTEEPEEEPEPAEQK